MMRHSCLETCSCGQTTKLPLLSAGAFSSCVHGTMRYREDMNRFITKGSWPQLGPNLQDPSQNRNHKQGAGEQRQLDIFISSTLLTHA